MRRKSWIAAVIAALIVAVVVAVVVGLRGRVEEKGVKIGAVLPLTGSAAILGSGVREGMELAAEEVNAKDGVGGRRLEVVFYDSKNDAKEGVSAVQRLIDYDRVPAMVTAMSSVTSAAVPIADRRKIVLFGTVTATPGLTKSSEWVFRDYYTTDTQGEVMAQYLADAGIRRIAVIYVNDDYGVTGREAFKELFEPLGGTVLASEGYDKAATDMRAQATKTIAQNPDGILVISYGRGLATVVKQIRELGYDGRIMSYTGLVDPDVLQQAGEAAEGAVVAASSFDPEHPSGLVQRRFVDAYRARYGKLPSHYPAFGYDTLMLLVAAIRRSGCTSEQVRNGLDSLGDVELSLGRVTIGTDREVRFPQTVKVITNGVPVEVTPARGA